STKDMHIGLNLAIAHKIVEAHGGYMEIKSKVGEGTSFFVNLPLDYNPGQKEILQNKEAQKNGKKAYMGMGTNIVVSEERNPTKKGLDEKEDVKKLWDKFKKERDA
ncbi:MAG: ATP-binding protein, partial [bacterium]